MNRLAIQGLLTRGIARGMTTTTTSQSRQQGQVHPGYAKIKEKYAHFQVDDGVPIHLKGGPMDRVWYSLTLVMCGIGMVGCAEFIYRASFPKKAC